MSILELPGAAPQVILFDWHATLVDTLDAMYHAVDDVLPKLAELNLSHRLVKTRDSKTLEDARLVNYVRKNLALHPTIKLERKISRTDIFEVLFGCDQQAKKIAHKAFDEAYHNYFGQARPFEPGVRDMLIDLNQLNLKVGALSNRSRVFMMHELSVIDSTGWHELFHTVVCGDDVEHRKPAPDLILKSLENLDIEPSTQCWYVGDSTTDIIAAKEAKVTAVFYNGAGWEKEWIDKIFPGTPRHPHKPDCVVNNFSQLMDLVRLEMMAAEKS